MNYETKVIHAGIKPKDDIKGVNIPIHLSSTYVQDGINNYHDFMYARGNNPTRYYTETLVAQLDNAKYALGFASGLAATATTLNLFKQGDKIIFSNNLYGGTYRYLSNILDNQGIDYQIVDNIDLLDVKDIDDNVKAIYIETPSNPLLKTTDIARVAKLTKEKGILLIVDNTFLTSYYQKPLVLGADIIVYSATKYYSGHSDVLAGFIVIDDEELYTKLKFLQNTLGGVLSPFDSYLIQRGIKTLALRLERSSANALAIAHYLEKHKAIKQVFYPGLESQDDYDLVLKQTNGFGSVMSLLLNDNYDYEIFANGLELFDFAVSLGGVESLICHPSTMTHESYSIEEQAKVGVKPDLLRLSIGVEHIDDLLNDIKQALKKSRKKEIK